MPPVPVKIPAWADPANASVLDSWFQRAARTVGSLIGAADPTAQAMGIAAPLEIPANEAAASIGTLTQPIKAYHGSPHDFDQFSLSKVGSGEGGQAYGHGLYFAENPAVAHEYRKTLAQPNDIEARSVLDVLPKPFQGPDNVRNIFNDLYDAMAKGEIQKPSDFAKVYEVSPLLKDAYEKAGAILDGKGKTYEVNLHASPDEFLDWDKPLSQQPPKVQEGLAKSGILPEWYPEWAKIAKRQDEISELPTARHSDPTIINESDVLDARLQALRQKFGIQGQHWSMGVDNQGPKGEQLYQQLVGAAGGRIGHTEGIASQKLKDAGIQGIQYLDQGSRAAGEGTKNFVVFDDKIIEIAKKYGVALPVAAEMVRRQQQRRAPAIGTMDQ